MKPLLFFISFVSIACAVFGGEKPEVNLSDPTVEEQWALERYLWELAGKRFSHRAAYTRLRFIVELDDAPDAGVIRANGSEHSTIRVTTGLLMVATERELELIIAHEFGHIVLDHQARFFAFDETHSRASWRRMRRAIGASIGNRGEPHAVRAFVQVVGVSYERAAQVAADTYAIEGAESDDACVMLGALRSIIFPDGCVAIDNAFEKAECRARMDALVPHCRAVDDECK